MNAKPLWTDGLSKVDVTGKKAAAKKAAPAKKKAAAKKAPAKKAPAAKKAAAKKPVAKKTPVKKQELSEGEIQWLLEKVKTTVTIPGELHARWKATGGGATALLELHEEYNAAITAAVKKRKPGDPMDRFGYADAIKSGPRPPAQGLYATRALIAELDNSAKALDMNRSEYVVALLSYLPA
ncbi:MAG: hypothetical protein P8O03_13495 [Ilumatobacter sp.]|nr:hypothetical protein [Ilumatobacter sp.]